MINPRKLAYIITAILIIWSIIAGRPAAAQGPVLLVERVTLADAGVEICVFTQAASNVSGIRWLVADTWFDPPAWGSPQWRQVPTDCWVAVFPSAHASPFRSLFVASDVGPAGNGQAFYLEISRVFDSGKIYLPR